MYPKINTGNIYEKAVKILRLLQKFGKHFAVVEAKLTLCPPPGPLPKKKNKKKQVLHIGMEQQY